MHTDKFDVRERKNEQEVTNSFPLLCSNAVVDILYTYVCVYIYIFLESNRFSLSLLNLFSFFPFNLSVKPPGRIVTFYIDILVINIL